jgi:hypothetical protein
MRRMVMAVLCAMAMPGVVAFDAGCMPEAGAVVFVSCTPFIDGNTS